MFCLPVCFPGSKACVAPGADIHKDIHCVEETAWCDGSIDCPGLEDEKYCGMFNI